MIAFVRQYLETTVRQTCKMERVEVRAVIKYICKKGMTSKEIREDFMKTLGNESPSYSTVKKWAVEFKRWRESIENDERSGRPEDATTDENVEIVHNLVMCDRQEARLAKYSQRSGHTFWGSANNSDGYLGYVRKGLGKMLTDVQKRYRYF